MKTEKTTEAAAGLLCRFCQSQNTSIARTIRSQFVAFDYHLYCCANCGSAFFDLAEHEVDLETIYAREAEDKAAIYERDFRPTRYWRNEVRIIRRLARRSIASILDVGCRTGDFLMHWPAYEARVGVELSERSAAVARARGLTIYQDYLEKVNFGRKFDVVSCYAVIEHLPDPVKFLATLSDLVNPDGVLVIMIPTHECLKRKLLDTAGKRWHMYSPPQHLSYLSRKILDETLSHSGFALKSRRYSSGGMFNPLRSVPVAGRVAGRSMELIDSRGPLSRLPIFDHLYSYFIASPL